MPIERVTRRGLLAGLGAFLAAPAIVRASSLMPIKAWAPYADDIVLREIHARTWAFAAERITLEDLLCAKAMLDGNAVPLEDRMVYDPKRDLFIFG